MILKKSFQVANEEFLAESYDLVLVCSGYERRASFLLEKHEVIGKTKICLAFDAYEDLFSRAINDLIFKKNGFEFLEINGESYLEIRELLLRKIDFEGTDTIKILIDYSSMSRVWYSYVLSFFSKISFKGIVELTFSYSHSEYVPPPQIKAYRSLVTPIEGYYSILPPIKPTALIMGLGYINRQAFGLTEYFEAEPFIFISRNSTDDRYYSAVLEVNKELIEYIDASNTFYYSLYNLAYCETQLNFLCRDLQTNYRIVLAPCGPKPFNLICLVTALKIGDIDVWRISASSNDNPIDKIPSGKLTSLRVCYSNS